MKEKTPLSHEVVCFFRDLKTSYVGLEILFVKSHFFLENHVPSEGAVSHNVLSYQQLPITRYQVRFYVNNYFEYVPIVSTAFQIWGKFATHNHESVKFKRRRQDGSL